MVAVIYDAPDGRARAERLAADLVVPLGGDAPYLLAVTAVGLELREAGGRSAPIAVDVAAGLRADPRRLRTEAVLRAIGVRGDRRPSVADATAGLGADAFLMAAAGCTVTLIERSGVVAALLADGLRRAHADPAGTDLVGRLTLRAGDARTVLPTLEPSPEVVYLDPMYPVGKGARKRKEMHALRVLLGDDLDADALLDAALAVARQRVVVKRPAKGAPLAGRKPSAVLPGKTTRFDLYLP